MIYKFKKISNSKFVRNVAIVATGTAGAQAITMVFAPVITRIYGPEAFGMLGTFMAILGTLTPIAALTYPIAIVLPKSDIDAKGIVKLSAILTLVVSAIAAIFFLIAENWIVQTLNLENIAGLMLLIPIAMLFSGYRQIFTQWLIRKKHFKVTARATITQALIINFTKAGVGWFHPVGAALIIIAAIGQAFHAVLLWSGIRSSNTTPLINDENISTIRELARRHKDFPLYRAPQVMLNAMSQGLPTLMLASFFGPAAAGFYSLGRTVLSAPSILIGGAVGSVFYPRITEAAHTGENLFRLLLKATSAMAAVGIVPFGLLIAFSPWLFSYIFGNEWIIAGEYARWLAIWLYVGFLNRPSVAAIATLGLQGFFLIYEIICIFIRIIALYFGFIVFHSDIMAIALFSISGAFLNAALVIYTFYKSKRMSVNE